MMNAPGILALFHGIAPGTEALFEEWFHGEHLVERVSVPGFRWGRRFRTIDPAPGFFTCYETDAPEVLMAGAYVERLNDPTPLTHRVMTEVFRDTIRTVCRRTDRVGRIRGAFATVARFTAGPAPALEADGDFWRERWERADASVATAAEEALRGGDAKITGAILADAPDEAGARARAADWRARWPGATVGAYALISTLEKGAL